MRIPGRAVLVSNTPGQYGGKIPEMPFHCHVLHVEQEVTRDEDTPLDTILATDLKLAQPWGKRSTLCNAWRSWRSARRLGGADGAVAVEDDPLSGACP